MTLRILSCGIGCFVFDKDTIVDRILYKLPKDYEQRQHYEKQLQTKYPQAHSSSEIFPKRSEYFEQFREMNNTLTQQTIKASVKKDHLMIAMVHIIEECDRVTNIFGKRLRDMLQIYMPGLEHVHNDLKELSRLIVAEQYVKLKELYPSMMNADISLHDWNVVLNFAEQINSLYKLRETTLANLEQRMMEHTPNLCHVAGAFLGAKLIELAGSVEKLAEMRSTTIQLLGAEKAMFRHLTTKARCPKHGIIINHPLILKNKASLHGKVARHLASALCKAVRIDYFKGDPYVGYQLKEELEKAFT